MVRPLNARIESSTKPASFKVSVWMATWMSISSATDRAASMAAGVVPQSSCSLRPMAPAATCSRRGSGLDAFPFPRKPRLMGKPSAASSIRYMLHAPAVHVVALVPVAGPVPPPIRVVNPAERASSMSCGQMKWIWESMPPAVMMRPSPAITSVDAPTIMPGVTPGWMSGLPALPTPTIRPLRMPRSAYWRRGRRRLIASRSLEAGLTGLLDRGVQVLHIDRAVGERVEPMDLAGPAEVDQGHDLLIARLEAHGGARGHVQSHSPGLGPIEAKGTVHLEEVEVGADLYRTVRCVGHAQLDGAAPGIGFDVAVAEDVLAWNHSRPRAR